KNASIIIEPRSGCSHDVMLVVFVQAEDAGSPSKRTLIRETWGNATQYDNRARLFFVMGVSSVRREENRFDDILQGDYVDYSVQQSFEALFALRWVSQHCPGAKFIMRADEAQFVNLFTILHHLSLITETPYPSRFVMCSVRTDQPVDFRKQMDVPGELYSERVFPAFCSVGFYILSQSAAASLINASSYVPYFAIDDIYVTGL
ncbi:hypothetical protein CAPTEDRAFT_37046, partial [Capitella teleta]